jgi:hypothetical protein
MGICFHDGKNQVYFDYCGGRAWNDPGLLYYPPANLSKYNTEQKIL